MTATERQQIFAANARRERSEARELELRIRLVIAREKISALETAEAKRQRALVESAVKKLVATRTVHPADHLGQFRMTEQFIKDPALIPLALSNKVFRAGPARQRLHA